MICLCSRGRTSSRTSVAGSFVIFSLLAASYSASVFGFTEPPAAAADDVDDDHANVEEYPLTDDDRDHWSFQPLTRPAHPAGIDWDSITSHNRSYTRAAESPLDHFIDTKLEARELNPTIEASRDALVRRLSFLLTGLPPTPEVLEEFRADPRPDAYERLVDRMLASPTLGEHLAQHWLDLARYAETDGFEHDKTRPEAWRYRDWVIDALNADIGYDEFILLQLAGDEVASDDPQARYATSFCLAGPDMPDINSQEERRHYLLNSITSNVGSVILGLQLGCAQCHDHKFDPISQADFYRLRAAFEPALQVKRDRSVNVLNNESGYQPKSHVMIRGDWRRPGPEVRPAYVRITNPTERDLAAEAQNPGARGVRTALAQGLLSPDHPLTSRVAANRVWQNVFGQGLARNESDFGYMGSSPSHPELLDWLAVDLIRDSWSLKLLRRRILISRTFRQAAQVPPESDKEVTSNSDRKRTDSYASFVESYSIDPRNRWLSRFPRQRLTGEMIRDAMLVSAGILNTRRGGPSVRPPLPEELKQELLKGHWQVTGDPREHTRRSIYIFARRNMRLPVFDAFDRPSANESCARRFESTTASQALQMINSDFSMSMARHLATRLVSEYTSRTERCEAAIELALGREASSSEIEALTDYLVKLDQRLGTDDDSLVERWAHLCVAILNTNEFMYLD